MTNIIFITGTLQSGGAERVISILANSLIKKEFEITIFCYFNASLFYTLDPKIKILSADELVSFPSTISKAVWLRKYVRSHNGSVIAFMTPFYIFSSIALLGIKTNLIISERGDPREMGKIRSILSTIAFIKSDRIVMQTKQALSYLPKWAQKKAIVIYNPISEQFSESVSEWKISKFTNTIIAVGRLEYVKNYKFLIESFAIFHSKYNDAKLLIYGDGSIKKELFKLVSLNNLSNCVFFKGNTHNIKEALLHSSVYILTSLHEGLPNSLIEAMYIGMPVISTKNMGAKELIVDKQNGILIDNTNESLVQALISLQNSEFTYRISSKAKEIREKVDKEKILQQWINLIHSTLKPSE